MEKKSQEKKGENKKGERQLVTGGYAFSNYLATLILLAIVFILLPEVVFSILGGKVPDKVIEIFGTIKLFMAVVGAPILAICIKLNNKYLNIDEYKTFRNYDMILSFVTILFYIGLIIITAKISIRNIKATNDFIIFNKIPQAEIDMRILEKQQRIIPNILTSVGIIILIMVISILLVRFKYTVKEKKQG